MHFCWALGAKERTGNTKALKLFSSIPLSACWCWEGKFFLQEKKKAAGRLWALSPRFSRRNIRLVPHATRTHSRPFTHMVAAIPNRLLSMLCSCCCCQCKVNFLWAAYKKQWIRSEYNQFLHFYSIELLELFSFYFYSACLREGFQQSSLHKKEEFNLIRI